MDKHGAKSKRKLLIHLDHFIPENHLLKNSEGPNSGLSDCTGTESQTISRKIQQKKWC
jgi:hypothetical protein